MAKLKAPLLSLGASQQLGKTLVFFNWKGINAVREYVIPANPDTQLQKDQRDYIRKGVAMIHTAEARETYSLDSDDQMAYSALATAKGKIMTWFNQAVKLWIDVKVNTKKPIIYSGGTVNDPLANHFHASIFINEETEGSLLAGKFYFGTSKTNLIHSVDATVVDKEYVYLNYLDLSAFLKAGYKYFAQFRPDPAGDCAGADSGIYNFVPSE